MINIKLDNNITIKVYDSIEEMPIRDFINFEKCLMIDSAIGSSLSEADQHFNKMILFINQDKKTEALQEIQNFRQQIFFTLNNFNTRCLSFACLVSNKKGRTMEAIKETSDYLIKHGITDNQVNTTLESVKKKYLPTLK